MREPKSLPENLTGAGAWPARRPRRGLVPVPAAMRAWECFLPHDEDLHQYGWSTRLVPQSCEAGVIALLTEVRNRVSGPGDHDEAAFGAVQNAEHKYRIMVRGDSRS